MPIVIVPGAFDPDLISGGALDFVVTGAESGPARRGLETAVENVFQIPHPDEPEDPLPNYASDIVDRPDGAEVWFDIADYAEEPEILQHVVEAVVRGLTTAGITDATLTNKRVLGET